jgi:reactive intermediate/imine deaminase
MRTVLVVVCLLFASLFPITQSKKETKPMNELPGAVRFVKSENLPPSPGYSQAVEIKRGRIIYVAGQVALDRSGKVVGEGNIRAQAQQTFENLKAALEASGAKFEDVVKLNYYFSDITQLSVVREVRDQFINTANPPASIAVEVKRLFREPFLIEVEAVAVVPE